MLWPFCCFGRFHAFATELELALCGDGAHHRRSALFAGWPLYVRGGKTTKCMVRLSGVAAPLDPPTAAARFRRAFQRAHRARYVRAVCRPWPTLSTFTLIASPVVRNVLSPNGSKYFPHPRDSCYIRRSGQALVNSFSNDVQDRVRDQARRLVDNRHRPSRPASLSAGGWLVFDLTDVARCNPTPSCWC